MTGLFGVMDALCAETLGISVDDYIDKIEAIEEGKRTEIILALLSDNKEEVEKGITLFYRLNL